jgi:adenosylhomocysteine nucleosidase
MLAIGDIVIADRIVQYDAGLLLDDRLQIYQAGHIPTFNPTDRLGFPAGPDFLTRVKERVQGVALLVLPYIARSRGDRPPTVTYGTVLTGDQYVNSEPTRVLLHDDFTVWQSRWKAVPLHRSVSRSGFRGS